MEERGADGTDPGRVSWLRHDREPMTLELDRDEKVLLESFDRGDWKPIPGYEQVRHVPIAAVAWHWRTDHWGPQTSAT